MKHTRLAGVRPTFFAQIMSRFDFSIRLFPSIPGIVVGSRGAETPGVLSHCLCVLAFLLKFVSCEIICVIVSGNKS